MPSTAPTWVVIDPSTGMLNVTAPTVSTDTEFDFYIDSNIAESSQPIKKLIKITILKCKPSNWSKCNCTNSSVWEVWSSDYVLSSGIWTLQSSNVPSEAANKLSTTTTSVGAITMGLSALIGVMNLSSFATLWTIIHQLQIFKGILLWDILKFYIYYFNNNGK